VSTQSNPKPHLAAPYGIVCTQLLQHAHAVQYLYIQPGETLPCPTTVYGLSRRTHTLLTSNARRYDASGYGSLVAGWSKKYTWSNLKEGHVSAVKVGWWL
jgi:hypothetical protein